MNTAEQAESHTEVQTDTDTTPFSAYSAAFSNLDMLVDQAKRCSMLFSNGQNAKDVR